MFGHIKVQTLLSVKVSDRSLVFSTFVFHCLRQRFNSWSNIDNNGKSSLKKVNKSLTTSLFAKWRWAGINAFCDKLLILMLYCWIREYFTTGHELTIHAKVVWWTAELTLYNICFANIRFFFRFRLFDSTKLYVCVGGWGYKTTNYLISLDRIWNHSKTWNGPDNT